MSVKFTLFSLLISAAACPGQSIANWKVMFTATSGLASSTSGLDTDSPVFGDGTASDMNGVGVAGLFGTTTTPESVTLEVGQTLTVSASVTFTGGVTSGSSAYRFAVLNDAGKFATTDPDNWGGGWMHVVNTSSSGELYGARTNGNYMSTATNASDLNASKAYSGGVLSANSATPYLWTISITRDTETTVDLVSSMVGGPNNYSETYTKNDIATNLFTYNAVGMQATTAGDLDQWSISNAQYSITGPAPDPDSDGDGLPDAYEQTIIDANPGDAIDGLEDVMGTGASPAVTDFDEDGANDAEEYANGTNPLDNDSDNDGLLDGVENNTGTFVNASQTGTDPLDPDSDDDFFNDGIEVSNGTDPNVSSGSLGPRVLGVDFNRDDAFGSPSQSLFRVVSGSATQTANAASYTKTFGGKQVAISQPSDVKFEFRGGNGDSTRAIPGGDTSMSFLVSDFIATREGAIDMTLTGLPAGTYVFRSYHLDSLTGSGLGFAQGTTTTTPNTIEGRISGVIQASVQPTTLGSNGLNTTFINDNQIPTLSFGFTHNAAGPLTIELRATQSNGSDSYLLVNGFELFQANP